MKNVLFSLMLILSMGLKATNYIFSGQYPYDWTSAAQWSPSYPGTTINLGDTVRVTNGNFLAIKNNTTITINGVVIIDTFYVFNTLLMMTNNSRLIIGTSGKVLCKNYIDMYNTSKIEVYGELLVKGSMWESIQMYDTSEILIHPSGLVYIEDSIYNGYAGSTSAKITVNGTLVNDGTIYNEGTINGTGSIITTNNQLNGNIVGNGYVAPGLSPGELKTDFDYTLSSNGKLNMEIGGPIPGTNYDVLGGNGSKTLSGTLNVILYNGYQPQLGEEFTIINGSQVNGTFSTVNYPLLPNNLTWQITYNINNVKLKVILPAGIEKNTEDLISVYPIPATDVLFIKGLHHFPSQYKIFSMEGQVLQSGEIPVDGKIIINDVNIILGYLEIIEDDKRIVVKKISFLKQ
ncbi:MAG: hypothetical protein IPJ31_10855 [Bacteroidetes bacterium]|nr:hypothetical protein [Bacteroidota bacterium]MBP6314500.1 hypothetical protein [Chitinophagaceae bacterium]